MKNSDNPADPFKKAPAEATCLLSGEYELNVTISADPSWVAGDTMRLPQVSRRMSRDEVLLAVRRCMLWDRRPDVGPEGSGSVG